MKGPELGGRSHMNRGHMEAHRVSYYRVLINTPTNRLLVWSNLFTAGQYSLFPLSINVISLLVTASGITPLPDPEKHPNGWCLAVIRIWGGGGHMTENRVIWVFSAPQPWADHHRRDTQLPPALSALESQTVAGVASKSLHRPTRNTRPDVAFGWRQGRAKKNKNMFDVKIN
jgi:hypothetical protein